MSDRHRVGASFKAMTDDFDDETQDDPDGPSMLDPNADGNTNEDDLDNHRTVALDDEDGVRDAQRARRHRVPS